MIPKELYLLYAITKILLSMMLKPAKRHSIKIDMRNFLVTLLGTWFKRNFPMVLACIHYVVFLLKQFILCSQSNSYFQIKDIFYIQRNVILVLKICLPV